MTKETYILFLFISLVFVLGISCSENDNSLIEKDPQNEFSHYMNIKTNKLDYKLSSDFYNNYGTITAILVNTTQDTFDSKVGDAFNISIDQEQFNFAYQTDGFFEVKNQNGAWESVEQGRLIEGSKVIRIIPGLQYHVNASAIIDSNKIGEFRLKINYYKSNSNSTVDTLSDISNIFNIIK